MNWVWTKIGDIASVTKLAGFEFTNYFEYKEFSDIRVIRGLNIGSGLFKRENFKYIDASISDNLPRSQVKSGDLLISYVGTLGKVAIVPNDGYRYHLGPNVGKVVITQLIKDARLLQYFILSPVGKFCIDNTSKAVTQKSLSMKQIRLLPFPLPPLNEQRRIVAKIEALQTRSQRVKQELEAIKPLLDQFRQSVLAAAFRGDLTKDWREQNPDVEPASKLIKSNSDLASSNLPLSWCQTLVGDVVENLKYGTSKKCSYKIDGIPVLRIPNVVSGAIDHSDLKYAQLSDNELDKLRLTPGDILMIRSNGSVSLVGRTAIIDEAERGFAYAGYLIRLRPNRNLVYPKYLNLWFSSYEIRLQIEIPLRSTSGVNNINSDETKKLHIPLAPLEEQKEIVRRIESLFKLADNIEQQYQQAEIDLETLNQSILAKAFRGELVPQDPNDEPASVLLERIRKEIEKQKAAKKSKPK
ncbi:MAG: restriction endonuclease subunit S [Xenococcaceae cyanobacterium MO_207.B15]|nr:restriction endonuclease subunit S [Xenococcaceae cyanobacterium MO_207.B15]